MSEWLRRQAPLALCLFFLSGTGLASWQLQAAQVEKWRRHVVSLSNSSYSGNPFELEVDATFTHRASGTQITLPGYYDGNNTWKIGFMPTRVGTWDYVTDSSDSDLNNRNGSLDCVSSGLPGMLKADPSHPRKWKFSDADYVVPIGLRMEFFSEPASLSEFTSAADFLAANNLHLMETRLTEEYGQFGGRHDFIFQGDWRNHRFDLDIWQRMEQRMEVLTERGLGGHIMFYSDDAGAPDWDGQSATEALVIRYTVARLAGYPVVWFNTGIDISEYRDQSDINWLGQRVRALDPYGHPVSSRSGGGSGSLVMSGQTFESHGDPSRAEIDVMLDHFRTADIPVSIDDAWGENRGSHPGKDHRPEDIRRAFWKATVAGGIGGLIRGGGDGGSQDGFYFISHVQRDLESEQWLREINPFINTHLGAAFGEMTPAPSLVSNAYCLADDSRNNLLYFLMGENDRYDSGNGGDITLRLSGLSAITYQAFWFNPRTGQQQSINSITGGVDLTLTPPSSDDWVLLLQSDDDSSDGGSSGDSTPPSAPENLVATAAGESQIDLAWEAANDPESGIDSYVVYREGSRVGSTQATGFSDTGLTSNTTYAYEITAINGEGLEGPASNQDSATTDGTSSVDSPSSGNDGGSDSNTSGDGFGVDSQTIALYHFNSDYRDATGNGFDLNPGGNTQLTSDNLGWMTDPSGQVVRFRDLGDTLTVQIPDSLILPDSGAAFTLEARIYARDYKAYSEERAVVLGVVQDWDNTFKLEDDKWNDPANPEVVAHTQELVGPQTWQDAVSLNSWHSLKITFDDSSQTEVYVDGNQIASGSTSPNFEDQGDWTLTIGNFDGDIDEVRLSRVVRGEATTSENQAPTVDAGPDQQITLDTAQTALDGTVTDDGFPDPPGAVSVQWSLADGPASVAFNDAQSIDTMVYFSEAGSYSLELKASDGERSATDSVTIDVFAGSESEELAISGTAPSSYIWDQLADGKPIYIDRHYEHRNLPSGYSGLDYLQPANDDKYSTGSAFLSFDVNQPVTVLVAHDDRIKPKPAWLDSFTTTGEVMDIAGQTHQVYAKDYNAGTVHLGGNLPESGVDSPCSMYGVMVRLQGSTSTSTQSLSFSAGRSASSEYPVVSLTAENQARLTWESLPSVSYEILAADNLTDPDWVVLETVSADTKTSSWVDPDSGSTIRFYRVKPVNPMSLPAQK